uniref:Uncharacterized protein n=1 Tax=Anguilla anguilla TaxID=7936 RepID=A0A0E9SFM6_ANGAN
MKTVISCSVESDVHTFLRLHWTPPLRKNTFHSLDPFLSNTMAQLNGQRALR